MDLVIDGEAYLPVAEVAKRLGLSQETIRRWLRLGKMPGRKIGQMHYVREADMKRFLKT